jgi:hypothetical protein
MTGSQGILRHAASLLSGICVAVLCLSCSQGIDRERFRNADRAVSDVQRAVVDPGGYQQAEELAQRLSDEVMALQGSVKSKKERELAGEYLVLLGMYRDGLTLWRYHAEFSGHDFVPKGLIYVGQDVEPIVTKYRFQTESHVFGPTQQPWKSIPGDSIQVIWYNAGQQLKRIGALLKGEG